MVAMRHCLVTLKYFPELLFAVSGNDSEPAEKCENPPPSAECLSAISLTESWRNVNAGTNIVPSGGHNCDLRDMSNNYPERPWFRFVGDAGNMMLNSCPPTRSCGTLAGIWTDQEMPSVLGKSTEVSIFASYSGICKYLIKSILVMRCSYDTSYDFIYRYIDSYTTCAFSFCGMSYS